MEKSIMSKRKYINALAKHFCNSLHIASHDLKKCIWLWVIYIKHIIIQKKYEPKEPFFKSFKDNNQYTQICCNTELKLTDNSYDLIFLSGQRKSLDNHYYSFNVFLTKNIIIILVVKKHF